MMKVTTVCGLWWKGSSTISLSMSPYVQILARTSCSTRTDSASRPKLPNDSSLMMPRRKGRKGELPMSTNWVVWTS